MNRRNLEFLFQEPGLIEAIAFDPDDRQRELVTEGYRDSGIPDLMIDLHNPGWDFYCGYERYSDWNWVGDELVSLAKSLFPEYASPNRKSVWRKSVIKELIIQRAG